MSPSTRKYVLGATLAALCAAPAGAQAAGATDPVVVPGNPTCADIGPGWTETKFEPVKSGSFDANGLSGTVTVDGLSFAWTSSAGVDAVIVKGGDNANVYRYTPDVTSGAGLHAPVNPTNGEFFGLSHISFCQDFAPPPPPPAPCTPGGSDMKADGTPCKPAPCTEGGSDMKADGTPCVPPPSAPPAPPVTVAASSTSRPEVLGVVGQLQAAANATMRSPRRCVTKPFAQVFTGRGIKRITVKVNGRVVRTLGAGRTRYSVSIDPRRYAGGVMRVSARVEYVASSRKRPQTFTATVLRCAVQATGPQFTG